MARQHALPTPRGRSGRSVAAAGLVATCAALALAPIAGASPLPSAQQVVTSNQGSLALEPIGGYTDLGNVRILTTALCPEKSTNIVARISGAGFPADTNVIGNTGLDLVQRAPNFTGYVIPIFADWEYLASTHEAKLPLKGSASLAVLCADADLERIDARMEGGLEFESSTGKKSTYLQDGGPRIATGLPGIPPPGNGGVPEDAPTAPPVTTNADDQSAGQSLPGQSLPGQTANGGTGATQSDVKGGSDTTGIATDQAASASKDGGPSTGLLLAIGLLAALLAFGGYVFSRRPRSDDARF